MNREVLHVLRIPEGDIVVTRKVPMTDQTCDEIRMIKAQRESYLSVDGDPVSIPIPSIIQQLIHEEAVRIQTAI